MFRKVTLRPTSRRERNEVVTVTAEFAELANSVGDLLVELDRSGKIDLEREPEAAAFLRYLDKTDL